MKIIIFLIQHSKKNLLMSVGAGIFSGLCNAALLAVINSSLRANRGDGKRAWLFGGLCLLLPLARFISELLLTRLGQEAMYELRMQLCRQILAVPLSHLEQLGTARLLAILNDDVPTITNAILTIPLLCVNAALVVGCLIYLGILSWTVFLILLLFMAVGVTTYQLPIIKVQKLFGIVRKDVNDLQMHFHAMTHGVKELKIHSARRHAFLNQELESTLRSLQKHNIGGLNLYSMSSSWGQVLVFVLIGLIVFGLPRGQNLSSATLVGYALTLLYLMTPLQVTMNTLPALTRANIALKTVSEFGFTLATRGSEETEKVSPDAGDWKTLELKAVTHQYHREGETKDFTLGPLDLTFKQGEMIFVIGGNGSGKTTFVKLLTGLYPPENGGIYLDGEMIGANSKEAYRQYFSVVFSDCYLFQSMLAFKGLDHRASEYLDQLQLSHKVQIENGKLSTTDLSQGQKKRLALLTAFLEDRPIYVFDEWAADQDPYFKEFFYIHLLPELKTKHKTVFVITHDDKYYDVAERIIKLEDGQVISDTIRHTPILELASQKTI